MKQVEGQEDQPGASQLGQEAETERQNRSVVEKWGKMFSRFRTLIARSGSLLLALPAAGQLQVGDNLDLNANGIISAGYNGV